MKKNTFKIGIPIISLIILTFIASHYYPDWIKYRERKNKAQLLVSYYTNKPMYLPFYENDSISQEDFDQYYRNQPLKIVDYLNGDCSMCFDKLDFWKKFLNDLALNHCKIPILIYSNSFCKEQLLENINGMWPYPWIFDEKNQFLKDNELIDPLYQTMLLDKDNKVLIIGNPRHNDALKSLYIKTIQQYHP